MSSHFRAYVHRTSFSALYPRFNSSFTAQRYDHIQPDQQFLDKLPLRQLHSQSPHHHNFTDHENDLFAASHNLIEQENAVQLRSYGATIFDIFRTHGSSVESGISGFTNSTYFTQRDLLPAIRKGTRTSDFEWRFVNPVDLDLQLFGFSNNIQMIRLNQQLQTRRTIIIKPISRGRDSGPLARLERL